MTDPVSSVGHESRGAPGSSPGSASGSASGSAAGSANRSYFPVTRSGTYGFLAALPLLLLYEVMILVANRANGVDVRVGAEVWVKQLFQALGPLWVFVLGAAVCAVGVAIIMSERSRKLPIRPRWFGLLVLESALYAVVVAGIVSRLVAVIFAAAAASSGDPVVAGALASAGPPPLFLAATPDLSFGLFTNLALSIGAGLYEELVFRVVLVGGLFWLLRPVFRGDVPAYVIAALVGAIAFSWVHYIGPLGDPFEWPSFTFRFLFGLALNVVFLLRGFGVAAWTHALYDVFVVTRLFG